MRSPEEVLEELQKGTDDLVVALGVRESQVLALDTARYGGHRHGGGGV